MSPSDAAAGAEGAPLVPRRASRRAGLSIQSTVLIMLLVGTIIAVAKPSKSRVPCNRCGYDLVGTHELVCPECGGRLSVCVQEMRMQAYMADREANSSDDDPANARPTTKRPHRMPPHLTGSTPQRELVNAKR